MSSYIYIREEDFPSPFDDLMRLLSPPRTLVRLDEASVVVSCSASSIVTLDSSAAPVSLPSFTAQCSLVVQSSSALVSQSSPVPPPTTPQPPPSGVYMRSCLPQKASSAPKKRLTLEMLDEIARTDPKRWRRIVARRKSNLKAKNKKKDAADQPMTQLTTSSTSKNDTGHVEGTRVESMSDAPMRPPQPQPDSTPNNCLPGKILLGITISDRANMINNDNYANNNNNKICLL